MKIGFWNVRGWNSNADSDNSILRTSCVLDSNCDILGVAETHLLNNDILNIDGFRWFGLNRKHVHKNAKTGSGGVGFLIKDDIYNEFDIHVLDNSYEGIFWLELSHKSDKFVFLPCVCYLPPENSSRYFDVNSFYDNLMADIYKYQNRGLICISGDFNSRCGELEDYISGVDSVPGRNVIDFKTNLYGELCTEFLINTNMDETALITISHLFLLKVCPWLITAL